ncbi:hypothetical protein [Legionella sp. PC997]|uniref:hypothetical protein n=1 Tax=Legionella sp. PC997 TaxID=2755562 RepID=UPI0015FAA481|nr:hypothetical protein [Legionella sp. PC997]QMT61816.1 hypothetical protein HBNCFIEN_03222 [Legionella sp. PC997]
MWTKFFNVRNPVVGPKIVGLQCPSLLIRVDGRSLEKLFQQNGLVPRVSECALQSIRYSDVEDYQKFNEQPFAWGACSSLKDLIRFIEKNSSHTQNAWIHKFYGRATSLSILKMEVGMESDGHDDEKEQLVVEPVPFEQFIASTCPKFRDKFLSGALVPNAMHEYNGSLPKSMRASDLLNEGTVLTWLMINNCEETFTTICQNTYGSLSKEALERRFDGDKKIVDAIISAVGAPLQMHL